MANFEKRSRDVSARSAGFRSLRLEELFREEMNSLLDGEVTDPRLESTHITRVELSRDGSRARIWFRIRSGGSQGLSSEQPRDVRLGQRPGLRLTAGDGVSRVEQARAAFEHAQGFFRSRLCDALSLKRMPELRFRHDPAVVSDDDPYA